MHGLRSALADVLQLVFERSAPLGTGSLMGQDQDHE
jgi:hypothetical protein